MAKKTSFKDAKNEDLVKMLGEKREELRTLRFSAAGGRVKDASLAGKARKDIARILTEQTARKNAPTA